MIRRTVLLVVPTLVTLVLLLVPVAAFAASAQTVLSDAADGSIDGTYSAGDLRAADQAINAQEREYYLWDELYAAALRRLANPNAPQVKVVPVKDFNGNGKIDGSDVARSKELTKQLQAKQARKQAGNPDGGTDGVKLEGTDSGNEPVSSDDDGKADGDEDGSGLGMVVLLVLVPLAIIGFGIWRMRSRGKRPPGGGDGGSSFVPAAGPGPESKPGKPAKRKPSGRDDDAPRSNSSFTDDGPS